MKKIQEASQLRPQDPVITSLKDEIEKLFKEHDVNQKAETAYEKAQEALGDKRYDDARKLISEALRYKPGELAYEVFKQLIDTQEKLDTHSRKTSDSLSITIEDVENINVHDRNAGDSLTLMINGVKVVFRWCPPGEFMMGSPENEVDRFYHETQHKVVITKGFWLAETETTQAFWKAIMGNNPSYFKGNSLPVENVSWDDCQKFIKKLNEKVKDEGLQFRLSLPSEAHWEYACRAGTTSRYSWGDEWDSNKANKGTSTKPVGSYSANAWGLKDMHGNVWEWCEDWYEAYPTGTVTDPTGPESGSLRVSRGGGWSDDARFCRSAFRDRVTPEYRVYILGFRLELDDFSSN